MAGSSDANTRRIIAYGLRNPFRFTTRPGTSELWIGDVGWSDWEEIDRIGSTSDSTVENFGWPCYEGSPKQPGWDAAGLNLCTSLSAGAVTNPYYSYNHANKIAGESCASGSSSVSGIAFESNSAFPAAYSGALFFADYSRNCIWAMKKNGGSDPSPASIVPVDEGAAGPVSLQFGPDGNLYYADLDGGTIRRIGPSSPPPPGTSYLSDLSWTSMTNGYGPVEKDKSNGESAAGDGNTLTLNGTTYTKGLGAHAASDVRYALTSTCTRFKASVGVDDEVPTTGGSVVFQVYAGATLVYDSGVMTGATATKSVDVSIAGASELRLVVTNGGDNNTADHADWALARIECGSGGGDTTPPTITAKNPAAGATGVAVDVSPTATFSEAMNAATLTTSTFTLVQQGQSTPLAASVSYSGQTATLNPNANLLANTSYTATVKGGTAGAKDVAGNALAADVSWTFQTGSGTSSSSYLSDLSWTSMTNGYGPVEKDKSNGESASR